MPAHRILLALVAAALVAPVLAPAAHANHCGPVIIFGRVAQAPVTGTAVGVNAGGVGCIALDEDAPDVRAITPGSPNIQVRFTATVSGATTLTGTVSGLGLDQAITLTRVGASFDSPLLAIDPLATGDVTATVNTPAGTFTATFTKSA